MLRIVVFLTVDGVSPLDHWSLMDHILGPHFILHSMFLEVEGGFSLHSMTEVASILELAVTVFLKE